MARHTHVAGPVGKRRKGGGHGKQAPTEVAGGRFEQLGPLRRRSRCSDLRQAAGAGGLDGGGSGGDVGGQGVGPRLHQGLWGQEAVGRWGSGGEGQRVRGLW